MTTTRTYALLEVPKDMFDFVLGKLKEAEGYEAAILEKGDGEVHLDMHGIALISSQSSEVVQTDEVSGLELTNGICQKCNSDKIGCRIFEASDGGYEDFKYTCEDCGFAWWVDGIDA